MLNNKCSRCTEARFDHGKDRPRGMAEKNYAFFFSFEVEMLEKKVKEQ